MLLTWLRFSRIPISVPLVFDVEGPGPHFSISPCPSRFKVVSCPTSGHVTQFEKLGGTSALFTEQLELIRVIRRVGTVQGSMWSVRGMVIIGGDEEAHRSARLTWRLMKYRYY